MNISAINLFKINNKTIPDRRSFSYNNLKPLPFDTVSFGRMKKSEFKGLDLLVVNKFKAPIEKFNSDDDFQSWCKDQIEELKKKDLRGRKSETAYYRGLSFKNWCNYTKKFNPSEAYLILDGILTGLDDNNDISILPIDEDILNLTLTQISKRLKKNPKELISFSKEYKQNLQNKYLKELNAQLDSNGTGWVTIPSKKSDPKNFRKNTEILKTLSHKTWCTASYDASSNIKDGDFHIFLSYGKPRIGIKFKDDTITEINSKFNDGVIPIKYLDIVKNHIQDYKISRNTGMCLNNAQKAQEKIQKIEDKLKEKGVDFTNCTTQQLFDALNIKYMVDDDGLLIVDGYEQPDNYFTFDDLGIKEDKLLHDIKTIRKYADFRNSNATNLGALQTIKGYADFSHSKITSLNNLEKIKGDASFVYSNVTNLGKLKEIEGNAYFINSKLSKKDYKDVQIEGIIYD